MSNPNCKAGCGFICNCEDLNYDAIVLMEEIAKLKAEREILLAGNAMMSEALNEITKQPLGAGLACRVIANKALSTIPKLGQEIDKFDDEQFKKNGGMPYGTYGGY